MIRRSETVVLALAAATLAPTLARAQCAMCGTAVQSADDPLGQGLFWSVLFLISLPYTIVGAFIVALVWIARRSSVRRQRSPLYVVRAHSGLAVNKKENEA